MVDEVGRSVTAWLIQALVLCRQGFVI